MSKLASKGSRSVDDVANDVGGGASRGLERTYGFKGSTPSKNLFDRSSKQSGILNKTASGWQGLVEHPMTWVAALGLPILLSGPQRQEPEFVRADGTNATGETVSGIASSSSVSSSLSCLVCIVIILAVVSIR